MKKLFAAAAIIALFAMLSACGISEPAVGEDLILGAREWYTSLDSAKVEVVNEETAEAEQTFIYKYDEKGLMTYSYVGKGEGISLAQYNNGREQFTDDNGTVTALDSSDLNFTAYSREVPYPMAGEGLILFYKRAIIPEKSRIEEIYMLGFAGSVTWVHHEYDPEKLGQYDGEGEISAFAVDYHFDADGNFIDMIERTEITVDGKTESHAYEILISEQNAVSRVENVVDISRIAEEN